MIWDRALQGRGVRRSYQNPDNHVDPVQAFFVSSASLVTLRNGREGIFVQALALNNSFPLAFYHTQNWACFLLNFLHNDAQLYKSSKPFTSNAPELRSYHGKTPQILPALLLTGAKKFCWEKRPDPFTLIRRYIL
jgi:hypothetical protein